MAKLGTLQTSLNTLSRTVVLLKGQSYYARGVKSRVPEGVKLSRLFHFMPLSDRLQKIRDNVPKETTSKVFQTGGIIGVEYFSKCS